MKNAITINKTKKSLTHKETSYRVLLRRWVNKAPLRRELNLSADGKMIIESKMTIKTMLSMKSMSVPLRFNNSD